MNETPVLRVAVGTDPNGQVIGPQAPGAVRNADYRHVQLRWDAAHNGAASDADGRPVYDRVLVLRYIYPGTPDTLDVELKRWLADGGDVVVSDPGRCREFREIITRFEKDGETAATGTPLATINLDPAQIANLQASGVSTVEQLCDVPDSALDSLKQGGRAMRDRARAYFDALKGGAPMAALSAENEGLRADMDSMRKDMEELRRTMAGEAKAASDPDHKPGKGK